MSLARRIAYVDKPVSAIFFGTMLLGGGEDKGELLDQALALGVNAFDCAKVYGEAEASLGRWMKDRGVRDRVVVLTKGAHHSEKRKRVTPADIRQDFGESQERLQSDYVDIYLLHRDDPDVEVGPIVEVLNELRKAGKVGAFGGSNWTHRRIAEANAYAAAHGLVPFAASSPNFGLARQSGDPWGPGCVSLSGPDQEDARSWYRQTRMPVIAYSSLGRGLFSGRFKANKPEKAKDYMDDAAMRGYWCEDNLERLRRAEALARQKGVTVPQVAMAWIMRQPLEVFAICTTPEIGMLRQNLDALDIALSQQELDHLDLKS